MLMNVLVEVQLMNQLIRIFDELILIVLMVSVLMLTVELDFRIEDIVN